MEVIMFSAVVPITTKYRDLSDQTHPRRAYRYANLKKIYESKINFLLTTPKPSDTLVKLICQDTPFSIGNLQSRWERRRFINRCVKYFRARIREIERLMVMN